jgi:hypothetical protein
MKLISVFILLFSWNAWACNKKVDESKVVLFLNVNGSVNEIKDAKKAACKVGKKFVAIPIVDPKIQRKNNEILNRFYRQEEELMERMDMAESDEAYDALDDEMSRLRANFEKDYVEVEKLDRDKLRAAVKELAGKGAAIDTLIASGHDGGGEVYGSTGHITKRDIRDVMKEEYSDKPELLAQFNHLMLWGCYTTTENEVRYWKGHFPRLDLIAGFLGSGPSDEKVASRTIMSDLIIKSDRLTQLDDDANVKREIERVKNLIYTLPGVYLDTGDRCDDQGYYYSIAGKYDDVTGKLTGIEKSHGEFFVDRNSCEFVAEDLIHQLSEYEQYFYGYRGIPKNTSSGPIRRIYNFIRQHEHCLKEVNRSDVSGNKVGLLLFYNGVVDNFLHTFKDEVAELPASEPNLYHSTLSNIDREIREREAYMERFTPGMGEATLKQKAEELEKLKTLKGEIKSYARDFNHNSYLTKDNEGVYRDRFQLTKALSATQFMHMMVITRMGDSYNPKDFPELDKSWKFSVKTDRHLHQLDPDCMNFLEWHERLPNQTAISKCE